MSATVLEKPGKRPPVGALFTGMALFSMFFGAGNLIFPLMIGQSAGTQTPAALLGLALSAVAFPLLGLIAMMFYQGDLRSFLSRLGKGPAWLMLFLLQMAQGPAGSMPRLVTLMYASIKPYLPGLSLPLFSVAICILVFLLTFRPQKIIVLLGVVLTPLLLLSIATLVGLGWIDPPEALPIQSESSRYFLEGVKGGYQTMDLIAALLFATIIMPHLSQGTERLLPEEANRVIRNRMKKASCIAAFLLMVTYIALCSLSAHYSWTLHAKTAPEDLFSAIAMKILGPWGGFVSSVAIFLACLTTAISLAAVFSDYVQKDLFRGRISSPFALGITLAATAAMANLGFSGIMRLLSPILEVLYPALIALCLVNIGHRLYRIQPVKAPVYFVLGFAAGGLCFG